MSSYISSWKANHFRVSFFSEKLWSVTPEFVFQKAFGTEPDTTSQRQSAGESIAAGIWNSNRIEIKKTFNRLDFFLAPNPTEESIFPLFEEIPKLLNELIEAIAIWANSQTDEILRIAIGAGALLPTETRLEGYQKLKNLVRFINIDENRFRDFQLQINLPKENSSTLHLSINRISQWSALVIKAGIMNGPGASQPTEDRYYCSCIPDINTDSENKSPFSSDLLFPLMRELSAELIQILDKGIE